jgi:hypothetical protein
MAHSGVTYVTDGSMGCLIFSFSITASLPSVAGAVICFGGLPPPPLPPLGSPNLITGRRHQLLERTLMPHKDEFAGTELALTVRTRARASPGALAAGVTAPPALAEAVALPVRRRRLPLRGELE